MTIRSATVPAIARHSLARLAAVAACIAALCGVPGAAAGQDPQRPDTIRAPADTLVADTLPADTLAAPAQPDSAALAAAQDTLPPPPPEQLPAMSSPVPAGFATGVWAWDREALEREPYVTVADLLDRIPGINTVRSGLGLQPEAASVWGATAGSIEVVLDGYTMQPLEDPTFDLSRIELGMLEAVRVERRAAGLRLVLRTVEPSLGVPFSRIEAGIGEPISHNLFRGLFLTPHLMIGPLGAGIERLEVEGLDRSEPADMFTGWLKWGIVGRRGGVQAEYRQQTLDRDLSSPYASDFDRRDVVIRGRWQAADGLVFEGFGGRSSASIALPDTFPSGPETPDSLLRPADIERTNVQAGGRVTYSGPVVSIELGARHNNEARLPEIELDARAWLQAGRWAGFGAELQRQGWRDTEATTSHLLHGVLTPVPLVTLFAQYGAGRRAAPLWGDTTRATVASEHDMLRFGGQLSWRGAYAGGALIRLDRDSLFGFRLPFEDTAVVIAGDERRGWELYGHLPFFNELIMLDGGVTRWNEGQLGVYSPVQSWRAALSTHLNPLESGNFDLLARVEVRSRDPVYLPTATSEEAPLFDFVPARNLVDALLVIRIVTVQAFLRWEDMTGERAQDIPFRGLSGPRILYGVKWSFRN